MSSNSSSSTKSTSGSSLKWLDLLNESVHTSDDIDIGDVEAVNREFLVIKRGFVNVHRYFIPASKVEGWDGHVLWLKITEEEVKQKYENDKAIPDPARYLTKDYENYYMYGVYPPIGWIPVRYDNVPRYPLPASAGIRSAEEPVVFKCDLCGSTFRNDTEYANHVRLNH
jgi:hypothetical protein